MNDDLSAAMAIRPATLQRRQRLQALVAELGARDMDVGAVAALLQCSGTTARSYLSDLLEASVIHAGRPSECGPDCRKRNAFRLNRDPCLVQDFLAGLRAMPRCEAVLTRPNKRAKSAQVFGARYFHIMADDCYLSVKASLVVIRRDPLVAALFGANTAPAMSLA